VARRLSVDPADRRGSRDQQPVDHGLHVGVQAGVPREVDLEPIGELVVDTPGKRRGEGRVRYLDICLQSIPVTRERHTWLRKWAGRPSACAGGRARAGTAQVGFTWVSGPRFDKPVHAGWPVR